MINEELRTFIAKMRAAGKTDLEIAAELKTAGWDEAAINQELSSKTSKTRFNLGKIKFWIWLYGIAILLEIASIMFGRMVHSNSNAVAFVAEFVVTSTMIYTFGIVPIVTLLAIGLKISFWILRLIPHFKDSKSLKQLDHKWLLVVSTAITGIIMLWVGYLGAKDPSLEMGSLVFLLIAILGGILLAFSLIFALALIVVQKIARKNWWKVGLAVLVVIAVGIYVLGKYTKKNSYPIKPTIDKVEFLYTSPTPLPTIIPKIGDTLDYRNLQTDTSSWKEYKKEVDGLLISFKYPKQYEIWKYSQGRPAEFDSQIVKADTSGHLENTLVEFRRPKDREGKDPITYDGKPFTRWVQEGNYYFTDQASIIREVIIKFKEIVRVEYSHGRVPFTHPYGPSGETYVVVDNNYPFIFINHNLIQLDEFIAILDSFKVEKCFKFCQSK